MLAIAPVGPKMLKLELPQIPWIIEPKMAAYSPIIGFAPEEMASATDKGIDTSTTIKADIKFCIKH